MPQTQTRLRLSEMAIGDYWLMENPTRLIRVESAEEVHEAIPGSTTMHTKPALRVRATVAGFKIPGHIGERRAEANRKINAAIIGNCAIGGEEGDDVEWGEVYTERLVPPVRTSKRDGGFDFVDDDPAKVASWVPQFYCIETEGRRGARARLSMPARGQLEGVKIDPALMPATVFRGDVAPEAPKPAPRDQNAPVVYVPIPTVGDQPVTTCHPPSDSEKYTWERLSVTTDLNPTVADVQRMADEMGVDLSDITGPNAAIEGWKRLEETAKARMAAQLESATGTSEPPKPPDPRMTIFRARKLAAEAGVDVSDLSGEGSLALILARLAKEQRA